MPTVTVRHGRSCTVGSVTWPLRAGFLVTVLAVVPASHGAELQSPNGKLLVTVGIKEHLEPYPIGPLPADECGRLLDERAG